MNYDFTKLEYVGCQSVSIIRRKKKVNVLLNELLLENLTVESSD